MLVNNNGLAANIAIASPYFTQELRGPVLNQALAAEGAAIARDMGERALRQYWADLVDDAIYDHGLGNLGHRTPGEAVIATLIQHGAVR
jgi:hypothetical protein